MLSINLSKNLFWDFNVNTLDEQINKTIIIERVFTRGDIPDIKTIVQFYGIDTIKQEIVKAGFLDNKTLKWTSNFLNIPKTQFRCYLKKQSNLIHWNY